MEEKWKKNCTERRLTDSDPLTNVSVAERTQIHTITHQPLVESLHRTCGDVGVAKPCFRGRALKKEQVII